MTSAGKGIHRQISYFPNMASNPDTAPLSPLSRHISPDGLGGEGEQFEDPVFPYWKFLQGAFTAGANSVKIKIGRSSATMEAYSETPFPGLREVCHHPPNADLRLEPWRSLAQMSVDPVALCSDDLYRKEFQTALKGDNGYQVSSSVREPGGLPERTGSERYRMTMIHAWPITGGFFAKMTRTLTYRTRLTSALRQRASFYPIYTDFSGQGLALGTPEQIFFPKSCPQLQAIYYRAAAANDGGRFLSEAVVADGYSEILNANGIPVVQPQGGGIARLWLEGMQDESPGEGLMKGWVQFPISGRSRNGRRGHPYLTDRAVFIPQNAGGPGKIAIVDRGVLLGIWEADLGVPGALAICGAAGLKIDFKGTAVAGDQAWNTCLAQVRNRAFALAKI